MSLSSRTIAPDLFPGASFPDFKLVIFQDAAKLARSMWGVWHIASGIPASRDSESCGPSVYNRWKLMNERSPPIGVDPVQLPIHQGRWMPVDAGDPDFDADNALQCAFDTPLVDGVVVPVRHDGVDLGEVSFNLNRALQRPHQRDGLRSNRSYPRGSELVLLESVVPLGLPGGNWVRAPEVCEPVDGVDLGVRREVERALARLDEILGRLQGALEA
jgi:hypothetical protein